MQEAFRIDEDQRSEVDTIVEDEGYSSRSEFYREAIRDKIRELQRSRDLRIVRRRQDRLEDGDTELVGHEEAMRRAGLDSED
jgi:Arc/MetJ-type ribon-helix-helix transcriptional regulator